MPKIGQQTVKKPTAVGAYIFAGGFTLGVKKHFDVLCHLEETKYGVATAQLNFPKLPIHVGLDSWPDRLNADFIYGNPPCAAWSRAGKMVKAGKGSWEVDDRPACTLRHFELMLKHRPKVWAWESVVGAFTYGYKFSRELAARAVAAGYSVSFILHCASRLGVPQKRPRYFMCCHRIEFKPLQPPDAELDLPAILASAGEPGQLTNKAEFERFKSWIRHAKPGEQLYRVFDRLHPEPERNQRGQVKGRPGIGVRRLPLKSPALTFAGYMTVHPVELRPLGVREILVLCGYPADYKLVSPASGLPALVARGVCPPVGEWLACGVAEALAKPVYVKKPTVTLYDFRKPGIDPVDMTSEFMKVTTTAVTTPKAR